MKLKPKVAHRVMSGHAAFVSGLILGAAVFGGCQRQESAKAPATVPASDVVATIDAALIRQADLAEALARRARTLGDAPMPGGFRESVLEELIREKVLLAKARAAGLERDPEMVRRWEQMLVAKYETLHKPAAEKQPPPSAAEVEQFHQARAGEFQRPERIRVAMIQIKGSAKATEEKRAELQARAARIQALAQSPGADFTELARLHSEDRATRYSGGDSGWLERGQAPPSWSPALTEAAFALRTPGAFAPLIEAVGSFYILKLIEREEAGVRSLAEVRERIVCQLKQQQRVAGDERFHAEQRAVLKIEINRAAVEAVPLPTPALAKNPAVPPSPPAH